MPKIYSWAVIGAGPAGIAAIGQLLDHGLPSDKIVWIDPEFKVGDFSSKWSEVSSNTKVELFLRFFESCQSFAFHQAPKFEISSLAPDTTCLLEFAAQPLQWITEKLKTKVDIFQAKVLGLKLQNGHWNLNLAEGICHAKNVIIAPGAEPKSDDYPEITSIPLAAALKPSALKSLCNAEDKVAVFGSSHSAILIIKALLETAKVNHVYNFYRSPLRYAVYLKDWILFDDTGLKGVAAEWARKHIDGHQPHNLSRIIAHEDQIRTILARCSKVIYATGFKPRAIPIEGMQKITYNQRSGIIAPGLFGLGIAFPEAREDRFGTLEHRVGLWKFMDYLIRIMPIWLSYGN